MSNDAYAEEPGRDYRKERDAAYVERNRLVAAVARLVVKNGGRAWLADHRDIEGEDWDPEWRTVVFIESDKGQLSWHLHDSDVALFDGLPRGANVWDGHDTPTKYERVARIGTAGARSTPGTAAGGDDDALIDAMLESVQCIDVSRRDMRDVLRVVRAWPAPATPATKDAK